MNNCPARVYSGFSEEHCFHDVPQAMSDVKYCCRCGKTEIIPRETIIHLGGNHGKRDKNLEFKRLWPSH